MLCCLPCNWIKEPLKLLSMRERNKQIYLYDAANFMGSVSGGCCEVSTHCSSQLKELWVVRNGSRKRASLLYSLTCTWQDFSEGTKQMWCLSKIWKLQSVGSGGVSFENFIWIKCRWAESPCSRPCHILNLLYLTLYLPRKLRC